eukprot:CAMPEP_0114451938 /NCGR_PEP_ID=MMETSP0104-20121206/1248_1 /TAXON_ID=37642 ORGANISM="Paraphysomonas imperforata, Strain PA2" /NCGR_SAMPLE_ID=MMETSP0104 /ASSEMBLY_ACC=CAM_ASM_000202 /LENGTH=693 /DNA_ID=CAMNT_0001624155 /DNA_START=60 /DNA_END=2143 /DNA_ORIENTATION=-
MSTAMPVMRFMLKVAMLLSILAITAAEDNAQARPYYVSVCNHASEPTFGEIFSFASPIAPDDLADMANSVSEVLPKVPQKEDNGKEEKEEHHWMLVRAFQELVAWTVETVSETKVPLSSLVSDGVFSLSTSSFHGQRLVSEIKLLQKKPYLQRKVCALAGLPLLAEVSSSLAALTPHAINPCQCLGGSLSLSDAAMSTSALGSGSGTDSSTGSSDEDWCVLQQPCEDPATDSTECRIRVDPLRQACAVFLLPGDDDHTRPPDEDYRSHYRFEIPTMQDSPCVHSWLLYLRDVNSLTMMVYEQYETHVVPLLSMLPFYPSMFLLASALLLIEEDIADSAVVQLLVTVVLGVLLAAIVLLVVLYRQLTSLKNNLPLGSYVPSSISSAFVSFALFATSFSMKNALITGLWSFWQHGAFGYPWVGKVYFGVSVTLSLFLKWYYSLFEDDSKSHSALRMVLQGTALFMLIGHSSPSLELGCLFAVITLAKDVLVGWEQGVRTEVVGYMNTNTVNYSGQTPLTEEEYRQQTQEHTQKALADLQEHLKKNVSLVYDFTDRYRDDAQEGRARLLERFVTDKFSGNPSERDRERILRHERGGDSDSDISEDHSSDDDEYRERKRVRRARKKRAARSRSTFSSVAWTLLLVLLVSLLLVAFVYQPVAMSGSAEWQRSLLDLGEGAASSVRTLLQQLQEGAAEL